MIEHYHFFVTLTIILQRGTISVVVLSNVAVGMAKLKNEINHFYK